MTGRAALVTDAPSAPVVVPSAPAPPCAPTAVTLTLVTPSGTENVSSVPAFAYVHVALAPDCEDTPLVPHVPAAVA